MKKIVAVMLLVAAVGFVTQTFAKYNDDNNYVMENVSANSAAEYRSRASHKYLKMDLAGAIEDLSEAIHIEPNNKELYLNRGYLKQVLSDFNGAMDDYNSALNIDSNYAYAYNNRGVLKVSLKDVKGAMQDYQSALKINPRYSDVYYNRANLKYMLDDNEGALADYNLAIEYNPKDSDAYNNRGVVKKRMNLNVGALSDYSQAIAINPNDSIAYANRGRLKKLYFDNEGAAIDLNQAVALAENQIFIKNVKPLLSTKHYIAAIPNLSAIINDNTDMMPIVNTAPKLENEPVKIADNSVNNKIASNIQKKQNIIQTEKSVNIKPEKQKIKSPQFNAGVASVKIAEAPDIRTTQISKPATTNVKLAESYYIRGLQKCILRDLNGAVTDLDKAIGNNPKYADAYYYRAAIKRELGDIDGFREDYAAAIKINPALQQNNNDSNVLSMIH